jgi:hypothetical protein
VRLELAFGADPAGDPGAWTWVDVSADLDPEARIQISRGRPDEAGQPSPSRAAPQLVNNSGDYTPNHPAGGHYPFVRQGVPARLSVQAGGPYLLMPDAAGATASVPSSAALDVSGDLDVRVDMALDRLPAQFGIPGAGLSQWAPYYTKVIGRYTISGGARMWRLMVGPTGTLVLTWSSTGANFLEVQSTAVSPYGSGQRFTARVTLDVDNGAGGHTIAFYTAPAAAGPWTALGDPIIRSGTTSINTSGTADLVLGDIPGLTFARPAGRFYAAELRNGIDGSLLASPDFTAADPGDPALTDPQGNVWSLTGAAEISGWRRRLVGEVAEWAPTWPYGDLSDPANPGARPGEARTAISIAGPLRRLGQGQPPLQSTLRRYIPGRPTLLAYWPGEDGRESTVMASAIAGQPAARTSGLTYAAESSLPSSAPLPTVSDGAYVRAALPTLSAGSTEWRVEAVYYLDEVPTGPVKRMLSVDCAGGGIERLSGAYSEEGIEVRVFYSDGSEWFATYADPGAIALGAQGWGRMSLSVLPDPDTPGQFIYRFLVTPIGVASIAYAYQLRPTFTEPRRIATTWGPGVVGMPVGHLTLSSDADTTVYSDGTGGADDGWRGERAVTRMRRLAEEEGLPMSVMGADAESVRMGPQRIATLLELVREAAEADGGLLSERRDAAGLQYRPRYLLYNQPASLHLSARINEIDSPFEPVLDDQRLRNYVVVSRTEGSSATSRDDVGISQMGEYPDTPTLNVATDDQLEPIAWWRLHRGTWPGMRYPAVTTSLDLAPHLIPEWLERAEGDRALVTDLPPQHPTDAVDLMIEGLTETISPTRWLVEASCSPGGVWEVGQIGGDDPDGDGDVPVHIDTDGSELTAPVDATQTAITVTATVGPVWTTDPTDMPVDIRVGGEVMTVTAITGAAAPQTFTVVRSVNGVSKAHAAGADVRLANPMILAW